MPRNKDIVIFSRNGIKIIKTEYAKDSGIIKFNEIKRSEALDKVECRKGYPWSGSRKQRWIEHKHKSPLGFYYWTYEREDDTPTRSRSITYRRFTVSTRTSLWELEYPCEYLGKEYVEGLGECQKLGIDMRPWDLCPGYKGFPDHMIKPLQSSVNKFLDKAQEVLDKEKFNEIKKRIMVDIFGYQDGPKIQPNDIKILAHGFDLKTSFRKPKEK